MNDHQMRYEIDRLRSENEILRRMLSNMLKLHKDVDIKEYIKRYADGRKND